MSLYTVSVQVSEILPWAVPESRVRVWQAESVLLSAEREYFRFDPGVAIQGVHPPLSLHSLRAAPFC